LAVCFEVGAQAASRTWIGGNDDWIDGGSTANWSPADEPDADDEAIFNSNNTVDMASANAVNGLTMLGGIDLSTGRFDLLVDGLAQLSGVGTNLFVEGVGSTFAADDVTIGSGSTAELVGGTLVADDEGLLAIGTIGISSGGALEGHGEVTLADSPLAANTLFNNNGTLTAVTRVFVIGQNPAANTLSINSADTARIDLDGSGETGVVNVNRNQTLEINGTLSDEFNGTLTMTQDTTLDVSSAWTLGAGGAINANNGEGFGIPTIPAGSSTISGGALTQTGGTITLVDNDGTLQFDAPFTMNGGNLVANGHVIFNANATIGPAANFTRPTGTSNITVETGRTLTINQANFDLDGQLNTTSFLTINAGASLVANLGDYDPDQVTNSYNSTINLNNGDISVNTADATFLMAGTLNMLSNIDGQITTWNGEPVAIGNDSGASDTHLNVTGTQQVQFVPTVSFKSDADVDIADGVTLAFLGTVNFDTVNAANHAEFTGAGRIAFSGQVNANEAVTLNMGGGTVDLDGLDSVGDFVNIDAPLTIHAASMTSFGRVNAGGGTNTFDVNNSVGTGVLTVNLDDPNAEWTLNGPGVMNLVNDNTEATLLAGSDVNINGTVNVTGDVRTTARLDIAGVVNINTAAQPLRLAGGNDTNAPNTIAGGTVSGVGLLGADTGKALHGFGTINSNVDFDGVSHLQADGGTLIVNGTILDVGQLGTADADGILQVTNAWNSNVALAVALHGGTLQGGMITNDVTNGIQGFGTVTSRVINNSKLLAGGGPPGSSLVFETAGNDNDWDGAANTGQLAASVGGTLELRDIGPAFSFGGSVVVGVNSRVVANGFALDFNPGSSISLTNGTYESTSSTDIGGSVTVAPGAASTIKVTNNFFLTFETGSTATLNANLRLENNNINIEQGATFSGGGALVIPDGSHLVADNLANIGVLVNMQGAYRPGNFEGIGRVDMFDYQQGDTGELYIELRGNALNAFDRLVASGDVVLDGYLNIDIDEISPGMPFVPALGQTFNIITANTVTGQFDYYDTSGMPAGLAFHLNYLNNAVQLEVVNKTIYAADFDDDGDVDLTDFAIWKGAFGLNQLGDANGDNISDAADYSIWRDQLGSVSGGAGSGGFGLAAVPEPASATILCGLLISAAVWRLPARSGRIE